MLSHRWCEEVIQLVFSLQAVPRAEELLAVVAAKLSTDSLGSVLSLQFISIFIQVSSILQRLQPFRYLEKPSVARHIGTKHWLPTSTSPFLVTTVY